MVYSLTTICFRLIQAFASPSALLEAAEGDRRVTAVIGSFKTVSARSFAAKRCALELSRVPDTGREAVRGVVGSRGDLVDIGERDRCNHLGAPLDAA
jgi:hypothetical protein